MHLQLTNVKYASITDQSRGRKIELKVKQSSIRTKRTIKTNPNKQNQVRSK